MIDLGPLRTRASAGDAAARVELVQRLVASPSPEQRAEAMQILLPACDQGDAKALLLHATLAARGVGRPQNFEEAIALLQRAAARGDQGAQAQHRVLNGKFDRAVWFAPMQLRQHHAAPRVFTVENFIPPAICAWFIEYARGRQMPTTIRDPATGRDVMDPGRSSTFSAAAALTPDLVIQFMKLRIAGATQTHVAQQESTSFIRYAIGQEYRPHYDLIQLEDEANYAGELRQLGQRIATVLVYLNEGYEGGETHFPRLKWAFKGKPGDALIFWNISAEGHRERDSLHAGLPVTSGEKWLLSQWVRARPVPFV